MEVLENVFSPLWWDEFLEKTNNMSEPGAFYNCMPSEETALMRTYILEILARLAHMRTSKYGYRVYLKGVLLDGNGMEKIYDLPPLPGETLEQWVVRAFGEQKFGMIINQGERFNLELSKLIALKIQPYLAKTGIPTEGLIYTLFIGNYDSTPLGIHKDLPGKSVMHFHLGPGAKTMYTWDDEVFADDVQKTYKSKPLELFTPLAKKHIFNEGDIYFMPENMYHIGTQEGLSIGIACWSYNRSNVDFAKRLLGLTIENFLQPSDVMLKPDRNKLDDSSGLEKTLELYKLPEDYKNLSFDDTLKEVYRDLRYSLHSNSGYRTSPFTRDKDYSFQLSTKVEIEKPYRIIYKETKDGTMLNVFVRGIKVEFKNFSCIKTFLDEINKGAVNTAAELLGSLDPEWPDRIGFYLLNLLYLHHGISIIS